MRNTKTAERYFIVTVWNIYKFIIILILIVIFLVLEMYNMLILITSELDTIKLALAKCNYEKL